MKLKISDEELDQNYLDWLFPEDLVTNEVRKLIRFLEPTDKWMKKKEGKKCTT